MQTQPQRLLIKENLHTQPNNTQYNAAIIGIGTEAKNAPNLPG